MPRLAVRMCMRTGPGTPGKCAKPDIQLQSGISNCTKVYAVPNFFRIDFRPPDVRLRTVHRDVTERSAINALSTSLLVPLSPFTAGIQQQPNLENATYMLVFGIGTQQGFS